MGPCFLPTQAFDLLYAKRRHFPYGITRQLRTFSHSDTLNHCTFVVPNMPPPHLMWSTFLHGQGSSLHGQESPMVSPMQMPTATPSPPWQKLPGTYRCVLRLQLFLLGEQTEAVKQRHLPTCEAFLRNQKKGVSRTLPGFLSEESWDKDTPAAVSLEPLRKSSLEPPNLQVQVGHWTQESLPLG